MFFLEIEEGAVELTFNDSWRDVVTLRKVKRWGAGLYLVASHGPLPRRASHPARLAL